MVTVDETQGLTAFGLPSPSLSGFGFPNFISLRDRLSHSVLAALLSARAFTNGDIIIQFAVVFVTARRK